MLTLMFSEFPLRNRVKELRERIGLRQADLADAVGITRQTIIAIEKGRLNPSVLISLKVARMLREPVDYVFYLAPGTEVSPEARGHVDGSPDKPETRKGKRGRPKGPRKSKESLAVQKPETEEDSAESTDGEPLEVLPEAEVLAPATDEEAASPTYEMADETSLEVDEVRYELDRDSEAATEEPQEEPSESIDFEETPESASNGVDVEETSAADTFESSVPTPEEHDRQAPVRETKSGQAIWDFF